MKLNESLDCTNRYSLELGKLTPKLTLNERKYLSAAKREKLFFIEGEIELSKPQRIHKKTIRELYNDYLYTKELPRIKVSSNKIKTLPVRVKGLSRSMEKHNSFFTKLLSERKETAKEFIKNSRKILLSRILVLNRKEEAEKMSKCIEKKEEKIKKSKKAYERQMSTIDQFIDNAKVKTKEQETRTNQKTLERQMIENKLEQLKVKRGLLKRDVEVKEEEYLRLLEYRDFMFTLDPTLKKRGKVKNKNIFMTEHNEEAEIKQFKEKLELDKAEDEIKVNFKSPEEVIKILKRMEMENIQLMELINYNETLLKQIKEQHLIEIQEKQHILTITKTQIQQIIDEEQAKKQDLDHIPREINVEDDKEVKAKIKELIKSTHKSYVQLKKNEKRTIIGKLIDITNLLIKLKNIRTYKILKGERMGEKVIAGLLKREEDERKLMEENAIIEMRIKMKEKEMQKKNEKKKWETIKRYKKTPKELMNKVIINKIKNLISIKKEQPKDIFNDMYFVS